MSDRIGVLFAELVREIAKAYADELAKTLSAVPTARTDSKPDGVGWMNVREAAKMLQVSPNWLYSEASRKRVPHHRVGRSIRFHREELDRWLLSRSP